MPFVWDWTEVVDQGSVTPSLTVTLSPLSRVLIRSALQEMIPSYAWYAGAFPITPSLFDDVDAAVTTAIEEIETEVTPVGIHINVGVFAAQQAQGVEGPAIVTDQWNVVTPIAIVYNNVGTGLDGSGGIALPEGDYLIQAWHTLFEAQEARLSVWNKSTSTMIAVGTSQYNDTDSNAVVLLTVSGMFSIASGGQLIDLRLWVGRDDGLETRGRASDISGLVEKYAEITIMRLDYD